MADINTSVDPEEKAARLRYLTGRIAIYGILGIFATVYLLPLVVVIFNSFRDLPEIAQNGLIAFPRSFSFKSWYDAWNTYCINGTCAGMQGNFYNSLKMTIPATVISTLLGALNGYILSKWRFKGSEFLFTCMHKPFNNHEVCSVSGLTYFILKFFACIGLGE